jgi:hypothetical protein
LACFYKTLTMGAHRSCGQLIFWRMSNPSQAHKKLVSDIHRKKTIYIHLIYAI